MAFYFASELTQTNINKMKNVLKKQYEQIFVVQWLTHQKTYVENFRKLFASMIYEVLYCRKYYESNTFLNSLQHSTLKKYEFCKF